MKYKEAILFIGKCLTLSVYPDKIAEIREEIRTGLVEWERVVWVSTGQFVFPAFYLQLQKAGLLAELPEDLVEYMEEITELNRQRNREIIEQAKEITVLLNSHAITPVFLKGTANLLDDLYEDIAERMVGDIDLLVDETMMIKTAEILIGSGYKQMEEISPDVLKVARHYPRLVHENRIAAIEVHRQILQNPECKMLDARVIIKESKKLSVPGAANVLNNRHQIIYNILNAQINDQASYFRKFYFRQNYDLFLLAQRENPQTVAEDFEDFFGMLNANLAVTNLLLDNPDCIPFKPARKAIRFRNRIIFYIEHPKWAHFTQINLYILQRFRNMARDLFQAIYSKKSRRSLYSRFTDRKWYINHLKAFSKV